MPWSRTVAVLALGCGLHTVAPHPTSAQNQVRRDRFEFQILKTDHFDLYYYDEETEMARTAGRMAERWYARLSRTLAHELRDRQPILLYAGHPHFAQASNLGSQNETARGVTEANRRRITLPFAGPLAETDQILGHELVHAFQFDMTQGDGRLGPNLPASFRMPLWFTEGMAQYLTVGPNDPITTMWVRDAAIDSTFPTLEQLVRDPSFAFRFGHAFWVYIAGRFGDDVVGRILNAAARTGDAHGAIRSVLAVPVDSLATEWRDEMGFAFGEWIDAAHEARDGATSPAGDDSRLNVAPALNPDGNRLIHISDRNDRSIDLFLSDAASRDELRDIDAVAINPRFEYIQFIAGAGEWSHDGTRFAYGKGIGSDPVLIVVDADGNEILERRFTRIAEVFDPTWSPDGRRIAFAGLIGGQSDLFVYDLALDSVTRLTSDPYAEVLPSWSPDGSAIVFSTDRFTTDFRALRYGSYRLATIDPEDGSITALPAVEGVNYIDPQWSPDGSSVFFLADPGGLTNVHRLDLETQRLFRVSSIFTGIAGITKLSPSLSVARRTGTIAFSTFEHGAYRVVIIDGDAARRGVEVRRETGDGRRGTGDGGRETRDGRRGTGDGRRERGDGRRETGMRALLAGGLVGGNS